MKAFFAQRKERICFEGYEPNVWPPAGSVRAMDRARSLPLLEANPWWSDKLKAELNGGRPGDRAHADRASKMEREIEELRHSVAYMKENVPGLATSCSHEVPFKVTTLT